MPIFEIEGPDGIYEVDAPDENAASAAFRQMGQGFGSLTPTEPTFLEGVGNRLYDAANALGLPASRMRRDAQGVDAFVRGAADVPTLGFADEISAGLGAATGIGGEQGNFEGNLELQRSIDEQDEINNPGARLAGQVAGGAALGSGLVRAGLSPTAHAINAGLRLPFVAGSSAVEGLALGGLHGFGSGEGLEDRLDQAETGAKWGFGLGAISPFLFRGGEEAARRAVTPFATSAERTAAADFLAREGVPLTAGQRTGSNWLRYRESELGGSRAAQMMEDQNRAFTEAAMSRAGQQGIADPDNMLAMHNRISQGFDNISARNTLRADQGLANDFNATMQEYGRLLPSEQRRIIADISQELVDRFRAGGGTISGRDYQMWRSRFSKAAQSARGNDNNLADAWRGLRNALDSAMERSINPADAGAWRELRRQWGNKRTLENAIASAGGEDAAMGFISPARLRMAAASGKNRGQYARGQNDFSELAHAGQATMTPLPNSGTPQRIAAHGLFSGLAAGGGAMAAGPVGLAAGLAAPFLAGRTLLSAPVQRYLGNQALTGQMSDRARAIANAILTGETSALAGRLPAP